MRMAFFGSAAELDKALKGGLDPNAATPGGTTLLMCAAHDPAKVDLLLKAGANATGTAKTGFDPLMVASMYPGNLRTLELLMAKGASPKPRKGVRFGITPAMQAVFAGDVAMVEALARAGADLNQVNNLVGQVPSAPLDAAVSFEEPEMIRVLAKNGATLDRQDEQGITALGMSAIMHKKSAPTLLRSLGADAGHKSKRGFTAYDLSETFLYPPAGLKESLRP
jgi:ankyrin repeat protein